MRPFPLPQPFLFHPYSLVTIVTGRRTLERALRHRTSTVTTELCFNSDGTGDSGDGDDHCRETPLRLTFPVAQQIQRPDWRLTP
jgi:hypothetical protein